MIVHQEALTRAELVQLQDLVEMHGDRRAACLLLVNLATVTKAIARRRLRASTTQCLRSRLRELALIK
jgi:hypothetical protein